MPADPTSTAIAIASLAVSVATLVVGSIVSVVLYALGRRLDLRSRLRRWDELRDTINSLLIERREDLHDVILVNSKRYENDYDGGNNTNRHGSIMSKGELLGPRHNGVELICGVRDTWVTSEGVRILGNSGGKGLTRAANVYMVGFVPFEYIEHINLYGDEYRAEVIFYVRYRGPGKSPYRSYSFVEGEGRHIGPTGRMYFDPVVELGEHRPNRFVAWCRFQRARFQRARMSHAQPSRASKRA